MNKSDSLAHYLRFSKCRSEFRDLSNSKKDTCFPPEFDEKSYISKKFWKHVKHSNNSSRIPEAISYDGVHRNQPKDKAELFNLFFCKQFSSRSKYDIAIDLNSIADDIDFSQNRVYGILRSLKVGKACGPDNIGGHILKNCASSLSKPLSLIYTQVYYSGYIPDEWKLAHIVHVHKKGCKSHVDNYRPISLLSISGKCLEYIIRDKLMSNCQSLLSNAQHGFMPQHSCTTQMVPFVDSLTCTLNNKSSCDIVYFDFQKAFDSVNHDLILEKLKYQYNIDGFLLRFIKNYLSI